MTRLNISSILAASFLFCGCIATEACAGGPFSSPSETPQARSERPDIVGGTAFPDMYHYKDPVTRTEVWGVRAPQAAEEETPPPTLYITPEINLGWPETSPRPRGEKP